MNRHTRLVDFQVHARRSGLAEGEQKPLNEALFSTFEPVRLWLKDRAIEGPFRKIAISLAADSSSARWHGNVSNAIGLCQVTEAVVLSELLQNAGDHRWVLGIVQHALKCVTQSTNWRSDELDSFIADVSGRTLPLVHFFDGLARVERASRIRCVPWLSTHPGETQIGVRIGERDVRVLSAPGPIYLEDSFPLAKSTIQERAYVLLDKAGKALATVPIDSADMH